MEFGICDGISGLLVQRHLCWLGHVARVADNCLPIAQDRPKWYKLCQSIMSGGVPRDPSEATAFFICSPVIL